MSQTHSELVWLTHTQLGCINSVDHKVRRKCQWK